MKRLFAIILVVATIAITFAGCDFTVDGTAADVMRTYNLSSTLLSNQPTPTDISYSLERYNLIRRAYWVNGSRERAIALPCEIDRPLGYIILFAGNATVGSFVVDGKVSSLNSFLTPDSERYSSNVAVDWLSDVDGSYGENDSGIFFFTPDGKYIEWTGEYLYSDIPFEVSNPVVKVSEG